MVQSFTASFTITTAITKVEKYRCVFLHPVVILEYVVHVNPLYASKRGKIIVVGNRPKQS